MYDTADKMAQGAALMTNTSYDSEVLGAAWPRHFNKVIAEEMYENIKKVGLPKWSEDDQRLAKAVQKVIESRLKMDLQCNYRLYVNLYHTI